MNSQFPTRVTELLELEPEEELEPELEVEVEAEVEFEVEVEPAVAAPSIKKSQPINEINAQTQRKRFSMLVPPGSLL